MVNAMSGKIIYTDLIEVDLDLSQLERQLKNIEEQIKERQLAAKSELERGRTSPYEDERDVAEQSHEWEISVVLPRMWRNPFLVSILSVYESAVTDIGRLLKQGQGPDIGINDLRGDFLECAKKYYTKVLQFKVSTNDQRWKQLHALYEVRNIIVHLNGRLDLLDTARRDKILRKYGFENSYDYLTISEDRLWRAFEIVKSEIEDLMARYKERATPGH